MAKGEAVPSKVWRFTHKNKPQLGGWGIQSDIHHFYLTGSYLAFLYNQMEDDSVNSPTDKNYGLENDIVGVKAGR